MRAFDASKVDQVLAAAVDAGAGPTWRRSPPRLRPPASKATVKQLITHTSGLTYWFWNADIVHDRSF